MLLAVTFTRSYSFSEFSSVSVTFFTVSAAATLMIQDCTASESLHSLIKCSLSSHCMHSYFVQHSVTFFSDTHYALHFSSVLITVTLMCLMTSQFMKSEWDCCVMMIVIIQHFWVAAFWIDFKLWLTHCSRIMYSLYNTEINVVIRACMSITSRLLLRNVFLTVSSHFKPFAFSNVCLKVVRCLTNDFSFCFNAFKIWVALSLDSELLYTCWSWLISSSMIVWFRASFDLIQTAIQGVTWLKVNSFSQLCKY